MGRNLDYPYIRAWGEMLGSMSYYILEQVDMAREDNAPPTAIYKQSGYNEKGEWTEGLWHTYEGITREDTKHYIDRLVEKYK
jgi:hypothetical protein